ncbi:B-cell lymphoma 3 protein homolog [Xenopus laevis]|uniref:B-cell lymphoma 3 protein homolog n=1 Tax=Xenopus laevis TaxID=8355 RepID=A0A8J1LFQ3_XENLA|nr:B-cell lymphoma 3 protein homolog [Xenopus laevis]
MGTPKSPCGGSMEASPLDLSTRKKMNLASVDAAHSPPGLHSWTVEAGALSLKVVKLEKVQLPAAEGPRESSEKLGACKDQASLPIRKRRYHPPLEHEGHLVKRTDRSLEWPKRCQTPCMTFPLPDYYKGASYLPSSLPLYAVPAPPLLNTPLLGILPTQHPKLLHADTQLQADIAAATRPDEDGDTALHIAVVHGNILAAQRVIAFLLHGARHLDMLNNLRQTPLHLAVITDQPAMVSLLLQHGATPQIPDRNGQTCVHLACEYESMRCLEILLRGRKWGLEATNYQGMTALHVAISTGHEDLALCLLDNGADVDTVDIKSGRSSLIQAVEGGSIELVSLLLQRGAQVNAQTYAGNTALHVASGRGLVEITRLLLRSGADGTIKNCHNDTAVTVAKDRMISDIVRGKSSSPRDMKERFRGEFKNSAVSSSPQRATPGYNPARSPT